MSDPDTPHGPRIEDRLRQSESTADLMLEAAQVIEMLRKRLAFALDRQDRAESIVQSVQAELLASGSPARLRAIVGITQESDTNAERS